MAVSQLLVYSPLPSVLPPTAIDKTVILRQDTAATKRKEETTLASVLAVLPFSLALSLYPVAV